MHVPTVLKFVLVALSVGAATAAAAPSPNPASALEDRQLGRCLMRPCTSDADCAGCNGLVCNFLTEPINLPAPTFCLPGGSLARE